jgi:hypothetical protein
MAVLSSRMAAKHSAYCKTCLGFRLWKSPEIQFQVVQSNIFFNSEISVLAVSNLHKKARVLLPFHNLMYASVPARNPFPVHHHKKRGCKPEFLINAKPTPLGP